MNKIKLLTKISSTQEEADNLIESSMDEFKNIQRQLRLQIASRRSGEKPDSWPIVFTPEKFNRLVSKLSRLDTLLEILEETKENGP